MKRLGKLKIDEETLVVKNANGINFKKPTANSLKEPSDPEEKQKKLRLMGGELLRTGFLVSNLLKY